MPLKETIEENGGDIGPIPEILLLFCGKMRRISSHLESFFSFKAFLRTRKDSVRSSLTSEDNGERSTSRT